MKRLTFLGTVQDRHVNPDDAGSLRRALEAWEGKRVTVRIEREPQDKTAAQLGYIFGVALREWAEHLGYDEDDLYDAVMETCMPKRERVNVLTWEVMWVRPRLSEATKAEASELIDRVIRQAAETGFPIRPPAHKP